MGLFRGAVFRHGGGALKQPIKEPTETPTSTLALMGRFPSLMGRFPALMGRFTDFVLRGRFTSWKSTGKQPIKKRGIKRLLSSATGGTRNRVQLRVYLLSILALEAAWLMNHRFVPWLVACRLLHANPAFLDLHSLILYSPGVALGKLARV